MSLVEVAEVPHLGAALLMLAIAVAVALLKPRRPTNFGFALFVGIRGIENLFQVLAWESSDCCIDDSWRHSVDGALITLVMFAAIHFGWVMVAEHAGRKPPRSALWLLWSVALLDAGLFALATEQVKAWAVLLNPYQTVLGVLVFVLLRTAKTQTGRRGQGFVLVAAGLLPYLLFTSMSHLGALLTGLMGHTYVPDGFGNWPFWLASSAGATFAIIAVFSRQGWGLRAWTLLWTGIGILFAVVALEGRLTEALGWVLGAFYASLLSVPILAGYALARHHLFGLDLKVKWTISRGTIAAVFVAVFFITSELAAEVLSERLGPFMGITAAGLLVFAISPLQRLADRVSTRAVPDAKPVEKLTNRDKGSLYEDQLAFAWASGAIDREERRRLDSLRERLGLSDGDAARLEKQFLAN